MKEVVGDKRSHVFMHIATILFGFTAILGKLITLNEFNLVWHRMVFASLFFLMMPKVWQSLKSMPKRLMWIFLLNGTIVAVHWLTFYGSIKIGDNASIPLACFGIVSTFTAILEPLIIGGKFNKKDLFLGLVVFLGLIIIAVANPEGEFTLQSNYIKAILVGVVSAFLAALFSIINRKYIGNESAFATTFLQMLGGSILLTLLLPFILHAGIFFEFIPSKMNIIYLLILVLLCTNIAFSMEMVALKKIRAFTASLILNLEPIYGIAAAALIFGEHSELNLLFYLGALIIIAAVFGGPLLDKFRANS